MKSKSRVECELTGIDDQVANICRSNIKQLSLEMVMKATDGFSDHLILGEGGFGVVFKGKCDGKFVAVKRCLVDTKNGRGQQEFLAEIKVLSKLQHRNILKLLGYCVEGKEHIIIYEFMCKGSLSDNLFGQVSTPLTWSQRVNIAFDIAMGVQYLHKQNCDVYVHRDLKCPNVLLDENLRAVVADFGMVKQIASTSTSVVTEHRAGTRGYMAYEHYCGVVSSKGDIYAFGVIMLELISGKEVLDRSFPEGRSVITICKEESLDQEGLKNIVDPSIVLSGGDWDSLLEIWNLARQCISYERAARPNIDHCVKTLGNLLPSWCPVVNDDQDMEGVSSSKLSQNWRHEDYISSSSNQTSTLVSSKQSQNWRHGDYIPSSSNQTSTLALLPDTQPNHHITQVSGPVVMVGRMDGAALYEHSSVGNDSVAGEIIRLEGDSDTIQVYEETTGLMVNDLVLRTKKSLSCGSGPDICVNISDRSQCPLKTIAIRSGDVYIQRGVSVPALNKDQLRKFQPNKLGVGDAITNGDLYATGFENTLMKHHVALPPGSMGKLSYIAPVGQYSSQDKVLELEFQGIKEEFTMLHTWHVRIPRPVASKLAADTPILTGQAEMHAGSGCSAYLASRLASFHERAGKVQCFGSPDRTGSLTIVGAVSPSGGNFSDPVTSAILSIVQVSWGLDKNLAQRKHFPSVNWLYSKYSTALESFYDKFDSDFIDMETKAGELLQREDDLNEIVQLVGKDALGEGDKIMLETAKLLREDYLAQNAFTPYDKYCPFYKSVWMMCNIIHFNTLANKAVERAANAEGHTITYSVVKSRMGHLFYRLVSQKFEDPALGEDVLVAKFEKLYDDLTTGFRNLEDEAR